MAQTRVDGRTATSGSKRQGRGVARATTRRRAQRTIMLASTGTPIDPKVIERVLALAAERPTKVLVLSVARIFGTRFGLPNPMLYPTKREWDEQQQIADAAAEALREHGIATKTKLVGSRSASTAIARWAEFLGCRAIVVGAPALTRTDRWLRGDEPNRVAKKTRLPVHVVGLPPVPDKRRRAGAPSGR